MAQATAPGPAVPERDSLAISVVIVAFQRKRFLLEAIASALTQSLPRDQYEVIVVKDFRDDRTDAAIRENHIVSYVVDGPRQGEWISLAAGRARGRVLALLDDDDRFSRDKLAVVAQEFASNPRLGFLHNGVEFFRTSGVDGAPAGAAVTTAPGDTRRVVIASGRDDSAAALAAFARGAAFNSSSISVRTELVTESRDELGRMRGGCGAFLFYAAWLAGADLLSDPRPLTLYRLHEENVSATGARSAADRWAGRARLAPTIVADAATICSLIEHRGGDPLLARPVELVEARNALLLSATNPTTRRSTVIRQAARLLRRGLSSGWRGTLPYLALAAARAASPALAARWPGLGALQRSGGPVAATPPGAQ